MSDPEPMSGELVALDLGSNSFHMVIASLVGGQLHIIDRLRERVRLAAGLDDDKRLDEESRQRGLECLARFGQRLRPMQAPRVRAVGTNTLRKARNARSFLRAGQAALGHPIEVISGAEEARLIYLGVSHDLADETGRRLVVDIGGGSTELILGERFEAFRTESLHIGCVAHTRRFFADGRISRSIFRDAVTAAQVELEPIRLEYRQTGWVEVVGSSGTINAIDDVLRVNGWSSEGITYAGLRRFRDSLVDAGRTTKVAIPGLSADRVDVIAGGLAILYAIFKSLRVDRMIASTYALREGLLYDTLGRIRHEDVRDRTISRLTERYHVDTGQADRVEAVALELFDAVRDAWALHHPELRHLLSWAARLHEIGLTVSFSGFHVHGAYLVQHSDLPGFSRDQQAYLAALIGGHRRRLKPERIAPLRAAGGDTAIQLAALLRISATLCRGRDPGERPPLEITAAGTALQLRLPDGWLDHTADLALEVWADDEVGVLAEAARALVDALTESAPLKSAPLTSREVELTAVDAEDRLVRWLNEVLFLATVDGVFFAEGEIRLVGEGGLSAEVKGRLAGPTAVRAEIKSATYHAVSLVSEADRVVARVVLDV